jgi:integrase
MERYGAVLRIHIVPLVGAKQLHQITSADVLRVQEALIDRRSAANSAVMVLLRLLRVARLLGYKTASVERPRALSSPGRTRFLSRDEQQRLLVALDKSPSLHAIIVKLLLLTGCRKGEILKLRWSEVDLDRRFLNLGQTKTGASIRPLSRAAADCVATLPRVSEFVFPGSAGHTQTVQRFWENVRAEVGIPDVRLHDLRHTFASTLVEGGVPVLTVARCLGHRTLAMVNRYAHLAPGHLLDAVDSVNSRRR